MGQIALDDSYIVFVLIVILIGLLIIVSDGCDDGVVTVTVW